MDVYFDDLLVTHQYSDIVAGSDYYPFGLEIKDRQITRERYRYGYQGQFAEKDDETGWNHFELREYDPVIGRWISMDPYGQHWSPFIGIGNDPTNMIDFDGGYSKWGASIRAFLTRGSSPIYQAEDYEWGFNAPDGSTYEVNGHLVNGYSSRFGDGSGLNIDFTIGLQAGVGVKYVGSIDVNVVNLELLSSDPQKYYDNQTTVANSIGINFKPLSTDLFSAEIGQEQNVRSVPGGFRSRGYKTPWKIGIGKYQLQNEDSKNKYLSRSIFSFKAILGIELSYKEKVN